MARGTGAATHNMNPEPGGLEITIWGSKDGEPDRKVGLMLGEDDVRRLLAHLRNYGF